MNFVRVLLAPKQPIARRTYWAGLILVFMVVGFIGACEMSSLNFTVEVNSTQNDESGVLTFRKLSLFSLFLEVITCLFWVLPVLGQIVAFYITKRRAKTLGWNNFFAGFAGSIAFLTVGSMRVLQHLGMNDDYSEMTDLWGVLPPIVCGAFILLQIALIFILSTRKDIDSQVPPLPRFDSEKALLQFWHIFWYFVAGMFLLGLLNWIFKLDHNLSGLLTTLVYVAAIIYMVFFFRIFILRSIDAGLHWLWFVVAFVLTVAGTVGLTFLIDAVNDSYFWSYAVVRFIPVLPGFFALFCFIILTLAGKRQETAGELDY